MRVLSKMTKKSVFKKKSCATRQAKTPQVGTRVRKAFFTENTRLYSSVQNHTFVHNCTQLYTPPPTHTLINSSVATPIRHGILGVCKYTCKTGSVKTPISYKPPSWDATPETHFHTESYKTTQLYTQSYRNSQKFTNSYRIPHKSTQFCTDSHRISQNS